MRKFIIIIIIIIIKEPIFYDLSLFMPMDFVSPCCLQANNFTKEVLKMFIKIH